MPKLSVEQITASLGGGVAGGGALNAPAAPVTFATLDDDLASTKHNVMLWGAPGRGKTTSTAFLGNVAAGMAPHTRALIIAPERTGLKLSALRRRGVDTSRLAVWPNRPGDPITLRGLLAVVAKVKADLETDPLSWAGVGVDTMTALYDVFLRIAGDDRRAKEPRAARPASPSGVSLSGTEPETGDYQVANTTLWKILSDLWALPCHTVLTAHERDVSASMRVPGYVKFSPALSPGLVTSLSGGIDVLIHVRTTDDGASFVGTTTAEPEFLGKDRYGVLPRFLVNPTAERVFAYLDEDITEDADPEQMVLSEDAGESPLRRVGLTVAEELGRFGAGE